jgi:transcription termination factor Rho
MNTGRVKLVRPDQFAFVTETDTTGTPTGREHYIPRSYLLALNLKVGDLIEFRVHAFDNEKTRALDVTKLESEVQS